MNSASSSPNDLAQDNNGGDSDSDSNSNESVPENYEPIAMNADDSDDDWNESNLSDYQIINDGANVQHNILPNGIMHHQSIVNGVRSLDLSDNEVEDQDTEKEEEEERRRADSEMQRAFQADEVRRTAPLPAENAARVREAMRGVSFGGFEPDWARALPDDQWIDQLRRLRLSASAEPSHSVA